MKKLLPLAWLLPAFLLSACVKDEVTRTYTIMRPIFAHKATVLEQIKSGPAKELQNPGKIFIKGNYIFINEVDKGIHIIDNVNPSSPKAVC